MADYSTTMGILQPQVGKSGDILLKFERKNGGESGIRTRSANSFLSETYNLTYRKTVFYRFPQLRQFHKRKILNLPCGSKIMTVQIGLGVRNVTDQTTDRMPGNTSLIAACHETISK